MVDDDNISALVSSAALIFVGTIFSSVSGLVERIVIGRFLGPEEYGVVSVCIAVVMLATTGCMLGLSQGIPRYIPRFNDKSDMRGIWASGAVSVTILSLIISGLLILFSNPISDMVLSSGPRVETFVVFSLSIPFIVLFKIAVSAIRGLENTRFRIYTQDLIYPITRILILSILLYFGWSIQSSAFAYLCAGIFSFVLAHLLLNRIQPLLGATTWRFQDLLTFSAPLVVSTMMSILLTRSDTIMLGYFLPSKQVGLYSAAYPIAEGLQLILSSFGFLYLPLASRLDANDERDQTEIIYELTTKWIVILTFPAFIIFAVFPEETLHLFWGAEYTSGAAVLSILSIGFFSSAIVGRNRETISAFGFTKYVMYANTFAFILNIVLNIYLIPRYGIIGAATSSAISFVSLNIFVNLVLKMKFNISPFSTYTFRVFFVLGLILAPLIVLSSTVKLPYMSLLFLFPVVSILTLIAVLVTNCLQPEDEIPIRIFEESLNISLKEYL